MSVKNKAALACLLALAPMLARSADQFSLDAAYKGAALASLSFDYRDGRKQSTPGFSADNVRIPGSACYAKIPGSDTLTPYLSAIKDKPGYRDIEETRSRMRDSVARNKLDIWQEILCLANNRQAMPYKETGNGNGGKWSSIPIMLNGERQGAWNDVFTIVRMNHLYSVTVHPAAKQ